MRKLLVAAVCAALAGCATLGRFERSAERIVGLVNSGQAAELAAMSRTPFLLDGELLLLDADVAELWKGIVAAGFRIEPGSSPTAGPLGAESYKRFASTMEVRTFFQKYVSDRGSLVELEAGRSRILLLLDRGRMGSAVIVGFKGPDAI
jgi:hypothetical protein